MIVHLNENGEYFLARWTDSMGKRRARSLGNKATMTRREAQKQCALIASSELESPSKGGKAPTLAQWQAKYTQLRENELAEGTMYLHSLTFKYLAEHFGEDARIDRINEMGAAEWSTGLGLKEQSRCLHIRNAKTIFTLAVKLKLVRSNPFGQLDGTPADVDKEWAEINRANMQAIFDKCPNDGWRMLFALCRWAGLRRGEAMRVKWEDIDWDTHMLTVTAAKTTTKAKRRRVPLSVELYTMLLTGHTQAGDGSVGPTDDVSEANLAHAADKIIKDAGLPEYAKPFHTLRKNCETEWMSKYPVLDVAGWLGHSPTVAAKHYTRATPETLEKVTGKTGTNPAQKPASTL